MVDELIKSCAIMKEIDAAILKIFTSLRLVAEIRTSDDGEHARAGNLCLGSIYRSLTRKELHENDARPINKRCKSVDMIKDKRN